MAYTLVASVGVARVFLDVETLPGNRRFRFADLTADWGLNLTPTGS